MESQRAGGRGQGAAVPKPKPHSQKRRLHGLDDGDVRAVVDSGARVSQNPTSALKLAKGTTQTGKWKDLAGAGVPMALGTDAENVSNHQDICRSMQLAALLPRDMLRDPNAVSAEQALEMATLGGATALWWSDEVGSLEPGKSADFVVHEANDYREIPYFLGSQRPAMVFAQGERVV